MPRYNRGDDGSYVFPLGIGYVSSSLKQVCDTVFCLNLNVEKGEIEDELKKAIYTNQIDVIATGGLSASYNQIKKIISCAKIMKPDIITMAGGGLVTAQPEVIMKGISALDIGMIAEGEKTIQELHNVFEDGFELNKVSGIIFRDNNGDLVLTSPRPDIEDLDSLPFPDYDGFKFDGHKEEVHICTSRSCPYSCSFCFHTCGKKYRSRSLDNIFLEIDWLIEKYNIKFLDILDELLSTDTKRLNEFCDRIAPYNIQWDCQMRVDRVDLDTLKKMKWAGCRNLSIGIESADNRVLRSMEKHTTIEQVESAIDMAKQAGICPFGNLLLGDIEDDLESFHTNLKWYREHTDIRLNMFRISVFPGSKLYAYAVQNGYIKDEVKYLEQEEFMINLTRMTDEQYKECTAIMSDENARREYFLDDVQIKKHSNHNGMYNGKGRCPLCGNEIKFVSRDFLGTKYNVCSNCGRNYTINLYMELKDRMEQRLKKAWDDKTILIWGMSAGAQRFIYHCKLVEDKHIYLADRNINRQNKILNKDVYAPEEILKMIQINLVLIGSFIPSVNDEIRKEIETKHTNIKDVYNLNEYLYLMSTAD